MTTSLPTSRYRRDLAFWRGPFRAIHTNIRKIDATLDADRLLDWAAEAGANVVMCGGGGIVCFYPTALPYQRVAEHLPAGRDLLGEIVEGAHRRGMRALARMDVGKHYRPLYEAHPDWFAHDRADRPLRVDELYVTCPNGAYRQRCTFEIMAEILDRHPVDGFFYNGFSSLECECETCRRGFEAATRLRYPMTPQQMTWEVWQALATYRSGVITALAERIRDFLHARDPQLMSSIDYHLTADRPAAQRERGFDNLSLSNAVDVITVEAHVTLNRPQPLWPYWAGEECLMARTFADDQPITILLSYFDLQGSRRSGQPPAQLAYDVLQIAAAGGQPWIAFSGTTEEQDDRRALPAVQETYRFLARHEGYYRDLRSAAQVAIVYSRPSFEWIDFHEARQSGGRPARRWVDEYRGCYAALVDDHIPFDVLYHEHIGPGARWTAERLAERYRLLVLPNVVCLSDQDAAVFDHYVALGGRLLCTGEVGARDRAGNVRSGTALRSLGVTPARHREMRGAYLRVRDAPAAGLHRLADVGLLPLDGPFVYTRPAAPDSSSQTERWASGDVLSPWERAGVRAPLTLVPPVANNTPEFAYWRAEDETDVPGLLRNRPNGASAGEAAWLPWPVGEAYWLLRHAPFGYLLGDLMRDLAGSVLIETDAPASVQMTLHRQTGKPAGSDTGDTGDTGEDNSGRTLLHVLNGTGRESRALEQVIPLGAMHIAVHAPGASRARSLVREADLPCDVRGDDRVAFTLPRLDAYDVIVLE